MTTSKAMAPVSIQTQANLNIDKNDIIAIQVAKAERMLNDELSAAQGTMKGHEKTIKTTTTDLAKSYEATVRDGTATALGLLKTLAGEFGGLKARSTSYSEQKDGLVLVVNIGSDYGSPTLSKTVPYTAEQLQLQEKLKTTKEALTEAQTHVVQIKQKLAKLPSLERQYRAALAEKALASTEQGQAILEAISGDVRADVLALPSA